MIPSKVSDILNYGWNGAPMRTFDDKHWEMPIKWARTPWFECLDCGNRKAA